MVVPMRAGTRKMNGGDAGEPERALAADGRSVSESHAAIAVGDLHEAISQLPVGITLQDHQGRFLFVNEAAGAHFNLAAFSDDALQALPYAELKRRQELCVEALRT